MEPDEVARAGGLTEDCAAEEIRGSASAAISENAAEALGRIARD